MYCSGWGRVKPEHAVDSMIQHADNGFTTFDMADHCKQQISVLHLLMTNIIIPTDLLDIILAGSTSKELKPVYRLY